jgi:hypothetical protein
MASLSEMTTPVPDPTTLTTEALHREVAAVKEILERQIECVRSEAKLTTDGITKLKEEKFSKVYAQFELVERARLEQKADTKDRVDAALSAQKEAAAKSEQSFTKQIDSLRDLMGSHAKTSDDKIAAIDKRVTSNEGWARAASGQ